MVDKVQPDVTLVGVTAHDVLLSPFLRPGKRLWNSYLHKNSIGFDNSIVLIIHAAFESPLSTKVQYYIHFMTGLMLKPKYDSYPCLANATSQ